MSFMMIACLGEFDNRVFEKAGVAVLSLFEKEEYINKLIK